MRHRFTPRTAALQTHTFLFADLVGFTRFTTRHGDERAAELAVSFHERVCDLAEELGCYVVKALGDAVMVRSEDGAVAVTLARRILALPEQEGFPLLRVGLDTGPAVERNGDWFGSTVNTASRVVSLASAGELLMTERTRDASTEASDVYLAERGRHHLEGLPEHVLFGDTRAARPAYG
jgi:adenylate cyclase